MRQYGRLIDISGTLVCHRKVELHLFLQFPRFPPLLRFFASPYNSIPQRYLSLISIQAIYPLSSHLPFLYFPFYLIIPRGSFSFCIVSLSASVKITEREPMLGYRSKSTKTTRHVRKLPLSTFQPSPPCSHPGTDLELFNDCSLLATLEYVRT